MKFNFKIILLGGLAFYAVQFIVGFATGPLIHDGVLLDLYKQNSAFWRPELNQEPPDMAALLPRWIATGLIAAFILAAIFDNVRSALSGSGWLKGLKFGVICLLFSICFALGWSGIFNLPMTIWVWWNVEALIYFLAGGAALGWVVGKLAPN